MTIRTESRIIVARGVDDAWDYLCDVRRWPEWAPTVLECRIRGDGLFRPGAWVEQRARDLGWNHRRSEQVTGMDPPHTMAFAGTMGPSEARWGMRFDPAAGGRTDALMWVEVDPVGILRAIPGRVLRERIQRVSDIEMAGIKAAIESDGQVGAGSP